MVDTQDVVIDATNGVFIKMYCVVWCVGYLKKKKIMRATDIKKTLRTKL